MRTRRLYKSRNKILCGVCGGIAEYLGIDPTIVRVLFAVILLSAGMSFIIVPYIIAAVIMDDAPVNADDFREYRQADYKRMDETEYCSSEPTGFNPGYDDGSQIKGFKI
jgi:phage shock protein PspC (stress-responsive transcriptional regulator)